MKNISTHTYEDTVGAQLVSMGLAQARPIMLMQHSKSNRNHPIRSPLGPLHESVQTQESTWSSATQEHREPYKQWSSKMLSLLEVLNGEHDRRRLHSTCGAQYTSLFSQKISHSSVYTYVCMYETVAV